MPGGGRQGGWGLISSVTHTGPAIHQWTGSQSVIQSFSYWCFFLGFLDIYETDSICFAFSSALLYVGLCMETAGNVSLHKFSGGGAKKKTAYNEVILLKASGGISEPKLLLC